MDRAAEDRGVDYPWRILERPGGPGRIVGFESEDGLAIEFALDDQNVAPRISDLIPGRRAAAARPRMRRRESGAALS